MAIENKILTFGTNKVGTIGGKLMGYTIPVPLSIPNIELWLNNDDGTMIKNGSNRISQWSDSSPNGRNFIQATGASQPLYVDNVVNSQGGIFFANNTAQRIACAFSTNIGTSNSITIIWSAQSPLAAAWFLMDGHSSVNRNVIDISSNTMYSSRPTLVSVTNLTYPTGTIISTVENNSTTTESKYFQNGIQIGSNFNNGSLDINGLTFGNRFEASSGVERTLNGYIHEVIIHSKAYTTDERTKLTEYLKTKYGIL